MSCKVKQEDGGNPAPIANVAAAKSAPKIPTPKRAKILDFGLAHLWEDNRGVREHVRANKRMITWLSPEQVNVISLETLGFNSHVMCLVASYHCARSSTVKAPGIDWMKAQALIENYLWDTSIIRFVFQIQSVKKKDGLYLDFPIGRYLNLWPLKGLEAATAVVFGTRSCSNPPWCMGYQEIVYPQLAKDWGWQSPWVGPSSYSQGFSNCFSLFLLGPYQKFFPTSFLPVHHKRSLGRGKLALQAAGVSEFYDIIFKHWDLQLKDLHAKRLEKARVMAEKQKENRESYQNEVIQILDDDVDLEHLEKESLQQAMDGVIVEGIINIDDEEPNIVKAPRKISIDDILKPTGVPPLLISETTKKSQSSKEQIERVRYLPFIV